MDTEHVKVFVKHNWMYLAGGLLGLIIVVKYVGRSSSSNTTTNTSSNDAQFMALMNAQAAQSAGQSAQIALANKNLDNQNAIAMRSLDVQNAQGNNATQVAWLKAQGDAALKTASASAMLVDSLNRPATQAIASSGQVTAAGLASSGMIGVAGFQAQSATVTAAANVLNHNTDATASIINTAAMRDASIAQSNAGVASNALKYDAQINDGYYGAMSSIAKSFMGQGQVTNYSGNAPAPTYVAPAPMSTNGGYNPNTGYSIPQVDGNTAYWKQPQNNSGQTFNGQTGYTLPNGGNSTLDQLYSDSGYG